MDIPKSGHTAGPFTAAHTRHQTEIHGTWHGEANTLLAITSWTTGDPYETENHANGALFAAAPDLEAVVKRILRYHASLPDDQISDELQAIAAEAANAIGKTLQY